MLSEQEMRSLPDHRLKEYLKVARGTVIGLQNACEWHPLGDDYANMYREDLERAKKHFALVKDECSTRPHFKK